MLFFFNDTATTEIYTLSLHDALPIWDRDVVREVGDEHRGLARQLGDAEGIRVDDREPVALDAVLGGGLRQSGGETVIDRKSTRLNSSHSQISYAVFCLKKKNKKSRTV